MFNNILRELRKIEKRGSKISVPISMPLDEEGYFDRRCPSVACQADFKVLMEDWKGLVNDEHLYCPICRVAAKATDWNNPQQTEHIRSAGMAHIRGIVGNALSKDAQDFNRRQRPGLINISLTYKPGARPMMIPVSAAEELRQKFTCERCGCRYSSLGAAFFCPACGHNSAESTFAQTVETVRKCIGTLPQIRDAVLANADADVAANTTREILESSLGRLVGAFQRISEALFDKAPGAATIRRRKNVFQNLTDGSGLWRTATGKEYEDVLTTSEIDELRRLFQQRHLIEHCEGIVDQDYIAKSGDTSYVIGQRIVVREEAVRRLAELIIKLVAGLKSMY